jgi:hypothetical protein
MGNASALTMQVDAGDAMASAQEIVIEAHHFECLDGPRMDRDCSRLHRTMRGLVDHATIDPVACEFMRHHQSGRTRPDDQHFRLFVHGMLLSSRAQEQKAMRPCGFPCTTKK